MTNIIKEGQHVVLKTDNKVFAVKVEKFRPTWMDKSKFKVNNLIGKKYGDSFVVKNKQLEIIQSNADSKKDDITREKDNRNLEDNSTNQKLSRDEIMSLKSDGVVGDGLIKIIVENSATFESKTEFSQQKYINKKKKKHCAVYTVIKPTPRLIHEMYYSRGPLKICNLRADTMAQILNSSNISSGKNVLIAETCYGILLSSAIYRMKGKGNIVNLYSGSGAVSPAVDLCNYCEDDLDIVSSLQYKEIAAISESTGKQTQTTETETNNTIEIDNKNNEDIVIDNAKKTEENNEVNVIDNANKTEENNEVNVIDNANKTEENNEVIKDTIVDDKTQEFTDSINIGEKRKFIPDPERIKKKEQRISKELKAKELLKNKSFDCLIVATRYHPTPLVLSLLPFIAPSRPIVVYCQNKEPLIECYNVLKQSNNVVLLNLSENWLREYQVLPSRTHPMMMMNATGGYVLTATTINNFQ